MAYCIDDAYLVLLSYSFRTLNSFSFCPQRLGYLVDDNFSCHLSLGTRSVTGIISIQASYTAVHSITVTMASAGAAAASLLKRQLKEMQSGKDLPGISCGLVNDSNIFEWEVMLMINDDCKYYGGTWLAPPSCPHLPSLPCI